MSLDDVAGCVEHAKPLADRTAFELAKGEYERSTSTLGRQRIKLSIASSDTEREIYGLKWTLVEGELRSVTLRARRQATDADLSSSGSKRESFFVGL